jgi:small GTP-binding protein
MLGSYGVGKTSLVSRFVDGIYTDRYLTTVGVKIDKRQMRVGTQELMLLLWDLAGEDEFEQIRVSHLRGAAGCLLVADGCRPSTLDRALDIRRRAREALGEATPFVLCLNKVDLIEHWALPEERIAALEAEGQIVLRTSAKTGENVQEAFEQLAARMLPGK